MILPTQVPVKMTKANIAHYAALGYEDKPSDVVTVFANDLQPNSSTKIIRACDVCGTQNEMKRSKYKPVCKSCVIKARNAEATDPTKTTCGTCGSPKSYQAKQCRTCSVRWGEDNHMWGKAQPHLTEYNLNLAKEDHHNWKGGMPRKRDCRSQQWSVNVRKAGACDLCASTDRLEAHHLESHDSNEELRWDRSNGVCLCNSCHVTFHKQYGFGKNTQSQYIEFKENHNGSN